MGKHKRPHHHHKPSGGETHHANDAPKEASRGSGCFGPGGKRRVLVIGFLVGCAFQYGVFAFFAHNSFKATSVHMTEAEFQGSSATETATVVVNDGDDADDVDTLSPKHTQNHPGHATNLQTEGARPVAKVDNEFGQKEALHEKTFAERLRVDIAKVSSTGNSISAEDISRLDPADREYRLHLNERLMQGLSTALKSEVSMIGHPMQDTNPEMLRGEKAETSIVTSQNFDFGRTEYSGRSVLMLPDRRSWAFEFKSKAIMKQLDASYRFKMTYMRESFVPHLEQKDLVVSFWWPILVHPKYKAEPVFHKIREHTLMGICSHTSVASEALNEAIRVLNTLTRGVFVHNVFLYRQMLPLLDVPLFYAPNGVDIDVFHPIPSARQKFVSNNTKITVGWAGSVMRRPTDPDLKGVRDYIMPAIKSNPKVSFREAVRESKWVEHSDMNKFYQQLDSYIVASSSEGTPNPALEASAVGVPLLSTRVGNLPELLDDGVNGYFIERDLDDLKDKLNIMTRSPNRRHYMGDNILRTIRDGWTWKSRALSFHRMFQAVLHRPLRMDLMALKPDEVVRSYLQKRVSGDMLSLVRNYHPHVDWITDTGNLLAARLQERAIPWKLDTLVINLDYGFKCFNLLSTVSARKIIFASDDLFLVETAKAFIELVKRSYSLHDFLGRLYLIDVEKFLGAKGLPDLTPDLEDDFMASEADMSVMSEDTADGSDVTGNLDKDVTSASTEDEYNTLTFQRRWLILSELISGKAYRPSFRELVVYPFEVEDDADIVDSFNENTQRSNEKKTTPADTLKPQIPAAKPSPKTEERAVSTPPKEAVTDKTQPPTTKPAPKQTDVETPSEKTAAAVEVPKATGGGETAAATVPVPDTATTAAKKKKKKKKSKSSRMRRLLATDNESVKTTEKKPATESPTSTGTSAQRNVRSRHTDDPAKAAVNAIRFSLGYGKGWLRSLGAFARVSFRLRDAKLSVANYFDLQYDDWRAMIDFDGTNAVFLGRSRTVLKPHTESYQSATVESEYTRIVTHYSRMANRQHGTLYILSTDRDVHDTSPPEDTENGSGSSSSSSASSNSADKEMVSLGGIVEAGPWDVTGKVFFDDMVNVYSYGHIGLSTLRSEAGAQDLVSVVKHTAVMRVEQILIPQTKDDKTPDTIVIVRSLKRLTIGRYMRVIQRALERAERVIVVDSVNGLRTKIAQRFPEELESAGSVEMALMEIARGFFDAHFVQFHVPELSADTDSDNMSHLHGDGLVHEFSASNSLVIVADRR